MPVPVWRFQLTVEVDTLQAEAKALLAEIAGFEGATARAELRKLASGEACATQPPADPSSAGAAERDARVGRHAEEGSAEDADGDVGHCASRDQDGSRNVRRSLCRDSFLLTPAATLSFKRDLRDVEELSHFIGTHKGTRGAQSTAGSRTRGFEGRACFG